MPDIATPSWARLVTKKADPLVLVRDGPGPTLFVFHDLLGGVDSYAHLAQLLERRVCGLQVPATKLVPTAVSVAEMLDQVLTLFDIVPEYDLHLMQADQGLAQLTARLFERLDDVLILILSLCGIASRWSGRPLNSSTIGDHAARVGVVGSENTGNRTSQASEF